MSGGQQTEEEQRRLGANLAQDVPYEYLKYLLPDDDKLDQIRRDYSGGKMLTGEVKDVLIELLIKMTQEHQKKRAEVTDEMVAKFMDPTRPSLRYY